MSFGRKVFSSFFLFVTLALTLSFFTLFILLQKLIIGYVIEEEGASNGAAAAAPPTAQAAPATSSTANGAGVGKGAETSPPPAEAAEGYKPKPASSVFAMDPPPIPPKRISISVAFGTKEEDEAEEGVERKEEK